MNGMADDDGAMRGPVVTTSSNRHAAAIALAPRPSQCQKRRFSQRPARAGGMRARSRASNRSACWIRAHTWSGGSMGGISSLMGCNLRCQRFTAVAASSLVCTSDATSARASASSTPSTYSAYRSCDWSRSSGVFMRQGTCEVAANHGGSNSSSCRAVHDIVPLVRCTLIPRKMLRAPIGAAWVPVHQGTP